MGLILVFTLFLTIYIVILTLLVNPLWVLIFATIGLIYGSLSSIVAMRRLYYLAGASPHIALLAVTLAIPTYYSLGGSINLYSIIYSLATIYIVGFLIHKGLDPDLSVSLMIGASTSLNIIAIYILLTRYSLQYSLTSLIIGDPLLTDWSDALLLIVLAVIILAETILTYNEQLSIGIDNVSTLLTGVNVKIYDLLAYTLLGLGVVGLLRITGYILEHVLLLIPPVIVVKASRSAREAFINSIIVSLTASLTGLHLSTLFNLPPSSMIGIILLLIYVLVIMVKRG